MQYFKVCLVLSLFIGSSVTAEMTPFPPTSPAPTPPPSINCPAGERRCGSGPISQQWCCPSAIACGATVGSCGAIPTPPPAPVPKGPVIPGCVVNCNCEYVVRNVPFPDANQDGQVDPGEEPNCDDFATVGPNDNSEVEEYERTPYCTNTACTAMLKACDTLKEKYRLNPAIDSGFYCVYSTCDKLGKSQPLSATSCEWTIRDVPLVIDSDVPVIQ